MDTMRDWLGTFALIIVRPIPSTYMAELSKAHGKFGSAVAWMVFWAIALNVNLALFDNYFSVSTLLTSILLLPIGFLFFVFCVHWVSRRVFTLPKDRYDELLYLVVANFVPFMVISGLVGWIPMVGRAFGDFALYYPLILTVVALKAITGLRIWQAIIAVVLAAIIAAVGFVCIGSLVFSIMRTVPSVM